MRINPFPILIIPLFIFSCESAREYIKANFSIEYENTYEISFGETNVNTESLDSVKLGADEIALSSLIGMTIGKPEDFLNGMVGIHQPCKGLPDIVNLIASDQSGRPLVVLQGILDSTFRSVLSLEGFKSSGITCPLLEGSQISVKLILDDDEMAYELSDGAVRLVYDGTCASSHFPSGSLLIIERHFRADKSDEYHTTLGDTAQCVSSTYL